MLRFCSWFLQLLFSVDLLHGCVVVLRVDLLWLVSLSCSCTLFVSSTCMIWYGLPQQCTRRSLSLRRHSLQCFPSRSGTL